MLWMLLNVVAWVLAAAIMLAPTLLGVLWFRGHFRLRLERRAR